MCHCLSQHNLCVQLYMHVYIVFINEDHKYMFAILVQIIGTSNIFGRACRI